MFWGWDLVGPQGLLDRVFASLEVPERSWQGLKQLPELGGIAFSQRGEYMRMVTRYLHILDSSLPTEHLSGIFFFLSL